MKRILIGVFATVVGLAFIAPEAEAKRFGGSKSFGMKRDAQVMKREAAPQPPAATAPAAGAAAAPGAAAQPARSSWLGPLAGLAVGAGLATMLAGTPFGGLLGALALGALIFFGVMLLLRFLRRPQADRPLQYAGAGADRAAPSYSAAGIGDAIPGTASASETGNRRPKVPADFDVEGFLRQAKLNFIRLQAANDSGNLEDLRSFTAPEVFAELHMQLQERGQSAQTTDVVTLNAEVLDVSELDGQYVVSVRFYGTLRETQSEQPDAFDEVWHLTKPTDGSRGWLVAGIQQFDLNG